jgi:acyl carrier protein
VNNKVQTQAVKAMIMDYLTHRAGVDAHRLAAADATLDSLGIDSLSTVEMLWELEEKLGVRVEDSDLQPTMTLDRLAEFVAEAAQPVA